LEEINRIEFINTSNSTGKFRALVTNPKIHGASVLIMGMALILECSISTNPEILAEHWIATARNHGAIGKFSK